MIDPYAKIRLLPDKNNVWQTRIHRRTLNPGERFELFFAYKKKHLQKTE